MKRDTLLYPLLFMGLLLGVWEILCRLWSIPRYVLPTPSLIFHTLWTEFPRFWPHILTTLEEMLLGLGLAVVIGVPLAFAMFRYPVVEKTFFPIVIGSQAVPVFAIAPLLVLWFGYGVSSKVIMASIIVFFPIVVNTLEGLKSTDPDLVNLLRSMGAKEHQIIWKVRVPQALPFFFTGLKIGVSVSTIGAVIGEWVGSTRGLGYLMLHANAQLRVDVVFAAIVYLTILGVGLFALTSWIARKAMPWTFIQQNEEVTP